MAGDLTLGYKASAEQFGPQELLDLSVRAEELGLDIVAVSDHFQPWRHTGGHSPAVAPVAGGPRPAHEPRAHGNLRADADDALPPVGRRAVHSPRSRAWHRAVSSSASAPGRR